MFTTENEYAPDTTETDETYAVNELEDQEEPSMFQALARKTGIRTTITRCSVCKYTDCFCAAREVVQVG